MKKILILAAFSIFCLTSCYQEVCDCPIPPKPYTTFIKVQPYEWERDINFGYACAFKSIPQLNSNIFDYGAVLVYLEDTDPDGFVIQKILPDIYPESDDALFNLRYDYSIGEIKFIAETSNLIDFVPPIKPLTFKVVLIPN